MKYSSIQEEFCLEKDVYFNFLTMFETLEDAPCEVEIQEFDSKKITIKPITLADVLQYISGSRFLPLLETSYFVEFVHNCEPGRRAVAHSCTCVVDLPTTAQYLDEVNFVKNFLEDMVENSKQFSLA